MTSVLDDDCNQFCCPLVFFFFLSKSIVVELAKDESGPKQEFIVTLHIYLVMLVCIKDSLWRQHNSV